MILSVFRGDYLDVPQDTPTRRTRPETLETPANPPISIVLPNATNHFNSTKHSSVSIKQPNNSFHSGSNNHSSSSGDLLKSNKEWPKCPNVIF